MKARYRHRKKKIVANLRRDPSGTFPLRRRFADELKAVWNSSRLAFNYSASEARDALGRWTDGGAPDNPASETNDTATDYAQNGTRTKSFLHWFGDWTNPRAHVTGLVSKVVSALTGHPLPTDPRRGSVVTDPDGKPLVVYHGTKADFSAFDPQHANPNALLGRGFYFSESKRGAEEWGGGNAFKTLSDEDKNKPTRVLPVYLNIKHPFDADAHLSNFVKNPGLSKFGYEFISSALGGNDKATAHLKKLGFDGITHMGKNADGTPARVWIAFEPHQVKSVANRGSFDTSDKSIFNCLDPRLWGKHLYAAYRQGLEKAYDAVHSGVRATITANESAAAFAGARGEFVANACRFDAAATLRTIWSDYRQRGWYVLAVHPVVNSRDAFLALGRLAVVRAHAEGQLDGYARLGISQVRRVADVDGCSHRDGAIYNLVQARGLIPAHVLCRCAWQPVANAARTSQPRDALEALSELLVNYSPDQPRDERGRWSEVGSGGNVGVEQAPIPSKKTRGTDLASRIHASPVEPSTPQEGYDSAYGAWRINSEGYRVGPSKDAMGRLIHPEKWKHLFPDSKLKEVEEASAIDPPPPTTDAENRLQNGTPIRNEALGGGANHSYIIELDNGEKAVWKPRDGEEKDLRRGVPDKTQYKREAAAYAVAKAIGMEDLIPPTTIRGIDGKVGSVQEWTDGVVAKDIDDPTIRFDGDTDLKRAAVFDYLVGNSDRHEGNWLVDEERGNKLRLIDHGLILPTNQKDTYVNQNITDKARRKDDFTIPPEMAHLTEKWPAIKQALESCHIEPDAITLAHHRLIDLTETAARGRTFDDLPPLFPNLRYALESSSPPPSSSSKKPSTPPSEEKGPASAYLRLQERLMNLGADFSERNRIESENPGFLHGDSEGYIRIPADIYDKYSFQSQSLPTGVRVVRQRTKSLWERLLNKFFNLGVKFNHQEWVRQHNPHLARGEDVSTLHLPKELYDEHRQSLADAFPELNIVKGGK